MPAPPFSWAESASSAIEETPRIKRVAFGDGYEQRSPDGLNPISQSWRLVFTDVGQSGGDAIMAYFRARGGWESFPWTPLWATQPIRVVCESWSRVAGSEPGTSTISATFREVHEP